jgi:cell wall-associated NlpC family hydrolase
MTRWLEKYQQIPFLDEGRTFEGCDCWGLVRLVIAEETGVTLPEFDGIGALDGARIADTVHREAMSGLWSCVQRRDVRKFDVVVMRGPATIAGKIRPEPTHIGLVVAPRTLFHIEPGRQAMCIGFDSFAVAPRILSFWRYNELKVEEFDA